MRRLRLVLLLCAAGVGGAALLGAADAPWLERAPYGGLRVGAAAAGRSVEVGGYVVALSARQLQVRRGARVLFESVPGRAFVAAARGEDHVEEARGMFRLRQRVRGACRDQEVSALVSEAGGAVVRGALGCGAAYELRFAPVPESAGQLRFSLELRGGREDREARSAAVIDRVLLVGASEASERFWGFGEQFSRFDLKGARFPVLVSEQGVGRGAEPITTGANLLANGAGGSWYSSYAPVPHFLTSRGRSLVLEGGAISEFDLRRPEALVITAHERHMEGRIFAGEGLLGQIEEYTRYAGRMPELPAWIHEGAVIGMQGGTGAVQARLQRLLDGGVRVSALWLQDWVGQRRTSFGKQLYWTWTLDQAHYPGWDGMVAGLAARGVRVLTYVNPFLVAEAERGRGGRDPFTEARERGYLVKDARGAPYLLRNTSFSAALIDFTNPGAYAWTKALLRDEVLGRGVSGWMADFGEGLPFDAVLAQGAAAQVHNRYPELWARLNREVITEAGAAGKEAVFFTRSGYTRSPAYSTLFWLGDQLVSWDQHDGIKTAVVGLLSGGVSGFSLNHSDLGGYTTIDNPLKDYHRSKELLWRWAELSALNVVMRSHEGNRPERNHQVDSDAETVAHLAAMTRLYGCWGGYRRALVREAAQRGWPVARALVLHYPADEVALRLRHEQFLLGSELLVAPVLDAGVRRLRVYLPERFVNLWTGEALERGYHEVDAPLGRPPLFGRAGSVVGQAVQACLRSI